MKRKFRAFYKPDLDTPDGAIKFIVKDLTENDPHEWGLWFVAEDDDMCRYRFDVPFFDDDWVVQDWTGFKDKNGVEIYEGDIVKFYYSYDEIKTSSKPSVGVIQRSLSEPINLVVSVSVRCNFPLWDIADTSEIIGDIFQKPLDS